MSILIILLAVVSLGIASGSIGAFTFLRKRALLGDAIAHAVLPGVALGFMVTGTKAPFWLILGACFTGSLSIYFMNQIVKRTKLKMDTAIAVVLSGFFGIGILLITFIQRNYGAEQTGLDKFFFGKAAAMLYSDFVWLFSICILVITCITIFYKEFLLVSFDKAFAKSIGLNVALFEFLLSFLTVLVIVTGIQIVGIILMAALLVTPASSARFWTNKLVNLILLSSVIASISGIAGALLSYSVSKMPTGPWIVIFLSLIAVFSILFAPKRGVVARNLKSKRLKQKMFHDNILKTFYHLAESDKAFDKLRSSSDLRNRRYFEEPKLSYALNDLCKIGLVIKEGSLWGLADEGWVKAKRIVKVHRLWEMYLTKHLGISSDHVHDDADTIEHFISPELEKELEKLLSYPDEDPHHTKIPYV